MAAKKSKTEKPVLAYQAHDGDEGWVIVFARSGAEARRRAADQMDTDWSGVEWCRRARSLDEYAPGPVPPKALVAMGWWFECWGCGRHVDDSVDYNPVYVGSKVFCCPWCRLDDLAREIVTRREEAAVKVRLSEEARSRWPGIKVVREHAYVRVRLGGAVSVEDANIDFTFPGGKYPVRYRVADREPERNGLYPTYADREAWTAFDAGLREVAA